MSRHSFLSNSMKTLCFALLLACSAHAEDTFSVALERSGWSEADKNRVIILLQQAEHDGLPIAPLRAKVHEGLAKQVPTERIITAVSQAQDHYRSALALSRQLTEVPDDQKILFENVVEVLSAGVPMQSVSMILAHQHFSDAGIAQEALSAMRDFARRGASTDEIEELGLAIASSRLSKRDIGELRTEMARHRGWGKTDTFTRDAMRRVSRGERGSTSVRGSSGGSGSQNTKSSGSPSRTGKGSSGGNQGSSKGGGSGHGR